MPKKSTAQPKATTIAAPAFDDRFSRLLSGYTPLLLLALVAFLLYLPSLQYDFSPMDEQWLILKRKDMLGSFSNIPQLFGETMMDMYYRPVCDLTFLIDNVLGHSSPVYFHFTNILLHTLCTLLVFRFFRALQQDVELSFFAALFFAVHPANVHAVAWIPGRNDSLLCLFALIAFVQLIHYLRTKKTMALVLHLLAFVAALFTKESAIVLPPLFFLLWRTQVTVERQKLLQIAGGWALLTIGWFFLRRSLVDFFPPLAHGSFGQQVVRFLSALGYNTGKVLLPVNQGVMPVLKDITLWPYLLAVTLPVVLAFKFGFRDRKPALFGLAWFFAMIVIPAWSSAGNSTGEQYEHRLYSALPGALLFLSQLNVPVRRQVLRAGAIVLALLFGVKTFTREPVYKSALSFTEAGVQESPSFAIFHNMLGNIYSGMQKHEKAIICFTNAITLSPRAEFYNNRAFSYAAIKDYPHALEDNTKSIELSKNTADIYVNRSLVYFFMNRLGEAKADLDKADSMGSKQIDPKYVNDLFNRMLMDTIVQCTKKLQQDSTDVDSYNLRGIILLRVGQPAKACVDFSRALFLEPGSKEIRANLELARSQIVSAPDSTKR